MPVFWLNDSLVFPHPKYAEPSGLLAAGGDLRVERLLLAYRQGIFPWYSEGEPILWFSPDPRLILIPDDLRVSKGLKKVLKSNMFDVKFDTRFSDVILNCAEINRKGQSGTWITDDMMEAYLTLHEEGFAHSVEAFYEDNLVGGLYGVSLGGVFFGESMFHFMTDSSKVAFYHLVQRLKSWNFDFIDSQVPTEHMRSLGASEIERNRFLKMLQKGLEKMTVRGKWTTFEEDVKKSNYE